MVLGLSHVIVAVVCFVPSCKPELAISAHLHGCDEVRMYPHGHPLHWKVVKQSIYIYNVSVIQSELDPGLNHVIVLWFVPSCESDSAISAHTHAHGFDEVRMLSYDHPLH